MLEKNMKLLVASAFGDLTSQLERQLRTDGIAADLTSAQSVDELVGALLEQRFDGLIADYTLHDIDIWKLSTLVRSGRFADPAVPIYLIQESCETEIPRILANEYRFKVAPLDQLARMLITPPDLDAFKPTLLIIEDEPDAANIAFHALADDYRIDMAKEGRQGFELWLQQRHDLILLDLMLPGLSGDRLLTEILAVDCEQPVIIVTAFSGLENHKNLLINGASEFLGKPYSLIELRHMCRTVHHRARLVSEIHYREDQFKLIGHQLWLLDRCLAKNDHVNSHRVMQRMQAIIPALSPSDDEQFKLLQSVASR